MHPQVNERAAAGTGFIPKPAARAAVAAQIGGLGVIQIAKIPLIDEILHHRAVVAEPADEPDHQQLAAALRRVPHGLGLCHIHGHGLFAQHMETRLQRRNRTRGVGRVPGADAHRVQLLLRHHVLHVGVQPGHPVPLALFLQPLLVDVAECGQFHPGIGLIAGNVHLGNAAHADDAHLDFLFHMLCSPLSNQRLQEVDRQTDVSLRIVPDLPLDGQIARIADVVQRA